MRTRGLTIPTGPTRLLVGLGLVAALTLGVAACSSDSGSEDAAPTPTPATAPPDVAAAMHDAAAALEAAPSYQIVATVVADGKSSNVLTDVVGPDRVHESVIDPDGGLTETLIVGSQAWTKVEQDPWVPTAEVPALQLDTRALFAALRDATAVSGSSEGVVFRIDEGSPYYATVDATDLSGEVTYTDGKITRVRYGGAFSGTSRLITIDLSVPGSTTSIDPPT
jgi:hypothetical protein